MRCAALGCQKDASPVFCAGCRRRLPRDLREESRARDAVVYLGQKDGYLTPARTSKAMITDNDTGGREYV